MNLYQNKYRIPTARATWHDYSGGAYFITICTAGRMHYFGEIENGEMQLSAIGKIASDHFSNVSIHYPYAEIPLFSIRRPGRDGGRRRLQLARRPFVGLVCRSHYAIRVSYISLKKGTFLLYG